MVVGFEHELLGIVEEFSAQYGFCQHREVELLTQE
jgi:hypothetical protein